MPEKVPVAILGATGSVGQRFVYLLEDHPWFEVVALTGSERTVGRPYGQACHWVLSEHMPKYAENITVTTSTLDSIQMPLVFSALPSRVAKEIEPQLARSGVMVCSNASAYRQEADVPILLPEVNPDHLELVQIQRRNRGWSGGIVTNSNCTSTGMTVTLKPLLDTFGIERVFVVSLQAVSGAGYPGVASLDIIDNVIPYIPGEEEKIELESRKMLGSYTGRQVELAGFEVSAHANRVAVSDGHMVCMSVKLREKVDDINQVIAVLKGYETPEVSRELPSAPHPAIQVLDEPDRPQPRLDRMQSQGMATVVGRVRPDALFDLKMVVLSHNTIRGAAGGSIYNAELILKEGLLS